VGDVRSLPLLGAFHTGAQLFRAPAALALPQLRQRVRARVAHEEELVLAPAFFAAVARRLTPGSEARFQLRRGRHHNELTRYRYDAFLWVGPPGEAAAEGAWLDWPEAGLSVEAIRRRLVEEQPAQLGFRGVPNARVLADVRAAELTASLNGLRTVADLRAAVQDGAGGVDPQDLWDLQGELPYAVEIGWSDAVAEGSFDVLFLRGGSRSRCGLKTAAAEDGGEDWSRHATRPLQGAAVRRLAPRLSAFLAERLPEYMVPGSFVLLESLPLTPNGKLDPAALPPTDASRPELADGYEAPRTQAEERLAQIWREVLGVERVGVRDNFFALGGHSLLATQLISKVRGAFAVDVGLRALFERPTVAGLAAAVALERGRAAEGKGVAQGLPALLPDLSRRHQPFPLTEVQQAYWIGRRPDMELGDVAAHVYMELESAALDLERLSRAWQRLIDRHDMLRAVVLPDGRQQILPEVPPYRIAVLDLQGRPEGEAESELAEIRHTMSHQVLPADRWPLFDLRASRLDGGRIRLHVSLDVLIFDGWSFRLLAGELARLYADPDLALVPLDISFRDYVLAEQALQETEIYRRSLDYWLSRLETLPPAPELPLAASPRALGRPRFERCGCELDPATWGRLKERAAGAGLTASALLLAAFSEVLAVWSKGPRFAINLTLFNRLPFHPQVHRLLGDFTTLTLLEVDASPAAPFELRARQLQERLWTDLDHRYVGGVRVLRELARAHGRAGVQMPVVFTSTLNLDPDEGVTLPPVPVEVIYSIGQTPQVWLDHQAMERQGALILRWDSVAGLFPPAMVQDMFGAYVELLERLTEEETWRSPRPVRPPAAQLSLFAASNRTEKPVETVLLHALFDRRAVLAPERTAVVSGARALTYAEVDRRSNRLGHSLRGLGVQPNTLVAVAMEKGWEQVVAVLAVLRAGAAYLPVDPGLPVERFRYLVEHGQVAVALTQARWRNRLSWPDGVRVLEVGEGDDGEAGAPLRPVQGPEDLAYVIFTSGSTGLPKGVMIDHRGATNTILDVNRRFGVGPEDRVLALSALSFDLSVQDVFGTLAAGATLVIPEAWANRDPSHWLELLVRERVTLWNSVPALMEMLVEYASAGAEGLPGSLRLVLLSGDWIPVGLPGRIRALAPGARVVSLGGATEASIWSILYPIAEVDPAWTSIPYGRAMDNQSFHVLDAALEPRPVWVPGDLYIGGVGLAKGYWRDAEKTRSAFVHHPRTGERLYRTGDLGRWLPDGTIEFLGREDDQVKIQGYRIELGEIEAALARHPRVQAAVVTAHGPRHGDRRLVAYTVVDRQAAAPEAPAPRPVSLEGGWRPPGGTHDPLADLELKLRKPGLRREPGRPAVELRPFDEAALPEGVRRRRSCREFSHRAVSLDDLSDLLGVLAETRTGRPLARHRYGSAGSLYPVQVYLHVEPGRVAGLAGGAYYYDPEGHRLVTLTPGASLDAGVHAPANRAAFQAAAVSLFLIARMEAIRPLYGDRALHYATLEAGLITQLLETWAPSCRLGTCQIGDLDVARVRPLFALEADHELLHSLLAGPLPGAEDEAGAPEGSGRTQEDDRGMVLELQAFLRGKLPAYMVPSSFVLLAEIPLTANGKVDRKALPEPAEVAAAREAAYAAPQSELEEAIAGIVREVLRLDQVGVDDSFFELGGNSVHLVQAHGRLREVVDREVPLIEMFRNPTVRSLAEFLGRERTAREPLADGEEIADRLARGRERRRQRLGRQRPLHLDDEERS
jgi:amino acid adenylation domain-containing protein